jgi:hypothetical protein
MNAKINVNSNLKLILGKYARLAMLEDCDIKSPESPDPAGDTQSTQVKNIVVK